MSCPRFRARLLVTCALATTAALGGCRCPRLVTDEDAVNARAGEIARALVDRVQATPEWLSPEQESAVGRALAIAWVAEYGRDEKETEQRYVREIGASIVSLSHRVPSTHGGYHFAIVKSAEPALLAAPGGYVFLTRGGLDRCKNEDEVAGLLAWGLAAVSRKQGERVMRADAESEDRLEHFVRMMDGVINADEVRTWSGARWHFVQADDDQRMLLLQSELNREADKEGSLILYDVGYDASTIRAYLRQLVRDPEAADRAKALDAIVDVYGGVFDGGVGRAARDARFARVMGRPALWPVR